MTPLTSGDRAALRRIQDHADRLGPGLPYTVSFRDGQHPHVLVHAGLDRGKTLGDLPPMIGITGYLDARAVLCHKGDAWRAERLCDGTPGLNLWRAGAEWPDALLLDLADGETLAVGPEPSAHLRAEIARITAPLQGSRQGPLLDRIADVAAGRLNGLRVQRHGILRLVLASDTPLSGWRPVALLEDGPPSPS